MKDKLTRVERVCLGVLLLWLFAALAFFCGGCAYKGGKVVDGTNLEIGICIPGTEWSINALSYTGGMKVAGNQDTSITVTNEVAETNSYFGVIRMERTTRMSATIEPTESGAADGEAISARGSEDTPH